MTRPEPGVLLVRYVLQGDLKRVVRPPLGGPSRRDGLWRHTCFEAFVRPGDGPGYLEFNHNWSLHWAAYAFTAYREGMCTAEQAGAGQSFGVWREGYHEHEVPFWIDDPAAAAMPWRVNIAMVVKESSRRKSYWALAHPDGDTPDFHDPACFVLELPPPPAP